MTSALIHITAIIVLFFASWSDLRTREIPDLLDYGLIFFALILNTAFSILLHNPFIILNSLSAFLLFLLFSALLFYTGQWGGGDSKLLIGLAALIGLPLFPLIGVSDTLLRIINSFLSDFIINLLFVGAVYGLLFTIYLMFKHKKKFVKKFSSKKRKFSLIIRLLYITGIILLVPLIFTTSIHRGAISPAYTIILMVLLSLLIFVLIIIWTHLFVKSVEESTLYKKIPPEELTEGDWIVKDIYYKGKCIVGHRDLGVDDEQIKRLIKLKKMNKLKYVLVREGIPFVPSFFLAYLLTLIVKTNFLILLLKALNLQ